MSASSIVGSTTVAQPANVVVAQRTQSADLTPEEKAVRSPAVVITLSQAAKDAIAQGAGKTSSGVAVDASKAVDGLLVASGADIYGAAINSLKTYPADLSTEQETINRLPNPTPAQVTDATAMANARNAREETAFFHFAHEANAAATPQERSRLMGQYYKAYTEYYDSLSPAEQNSDRYRGTRPNAVADYQSWSSEAGKTPDDLSGSGDPILMLFDKIKQQKFNVDDAGAKSVLQSYKDGVAHLTSSEAAPGIYDGHVADATDRFNAVQSVADQARKGDSQAFAQLKSLAGDPSTLSTFLNYAVSLKATA